jgi:hypothetical protein
MDQFPSDSKVWNPGVWFSLHLLALAAITVSKIESFIDNFKLVISRLPCESCRDHANKYLLNNPIENYIDRDKGMFLYVWEFHNFVNERLNKPILDFESAYNMYSDNTEVCKTVCGVDFDDN